MSVNTNDTHPLGRVPTDARDFTTSTNLSRPSPLREPTRRPEFSQLLPYLVDPQPAS